jgi:diadenosine tetraphosphate (Ap4A) HIT family hydrolase
MNQEAGFTLDRKLAADTIPVRGLAFSDLRLMDDRRFPWLILVPRRANAVEIADLAEPDQSALLAEIVQVSAALRRTTACDKLNVGALGNIVRQLHVHVVARFENDAAWPGPVWGSGAAVKYDPGGAARFVATLAGAGLG